MFGGQFVPCLSVTELHEDTIKFSDGWTRNVFLHLFCVRKDLV